MAKDKGYTKRVDVSNSASTEKIITSKDTGNDLLFGKKNYIFILIGIGLIFVGMALMSGGHMPSPDVWDESLIYSTRRITIAPMFILAGLIVSVYAIFVKK